MAGRLARLVGQAIDQVRVDFALGEDAAAAGGKADEVAGASREDGEIGLVDGLDEQAAAIVDFESLAIIELYLGGPDNGAAVRSC